MTRLGASGDSGSAREAEARSGSKADGDALGASMSLQSLYRQHAPRLMRFFAGRGARADAEDLVQETFARFASATTANEEPIERPAGYVTRIASNLMSEQARFAARRSAALHVSDQDVALASTDPVAQLEARDMLARLERAMTRMKPATREIFMAHRLDGCTYREIAAMRGMTSKGVEKQIAKAMVVMNRAIRGL